MRRIVQQSGMFMLTLLLGMSVAQAEIKISQAKWSRAAGQLLVKGKADDANPIAFSDTSGRQLGATTPKAGNRFEFRVNIDRPELLCTVRARSGSAVAQRRVAGVPNPGCARFPQCQILEPLNGAVLGAHQSVSFRAAATLKDRKAEPLRLEWDFGGGAQRIYGQAGSAVFERDNSRYQVRFTAWDGKKRYCEDQIAVTVGTPPSGLPAKVAEQPAPARGVGLQGEVIVLPFNDMAMQSGYPTYNTVYPWESINNLNAHVIRKGGTGDARPRLLTSAEINLRYSAASNPIDPVGPDSINSTSQSWPLTGAGHHDHAAGGVQKLDGFWGLGEYVGAADYGTWWLTFTDSKGGDDGSVFVSGADEGHRSRHNVQVPGEYGQNEQPSTGRGSVMPGKAAPYQANDPQEAHAFLDDLKLFTVEALPLSDVDDQGRVNSFPLMRVEATEKSGGRVLASADAAVTSGSDMSCRECHLKGGIGADPSVARNPSAFNFLMPIAQLPTVYEAKGSDIISLEQAALFNATSLHTWYNMKPWFEVWSQQYGGYDVNDPKEGIDDWLTSGHSNYACFAHHNSTVAAEFNIQQPFVIAPMDYSPGKDYPPLSKSQHGWHGRLQQDAQGKLIRDADGNPLLWGSEPGNQNPVTLTGGRNPNTLFPTDGDRPMEDNCLKCHAGKREQLYRDHHYTVGLKCTDCHGDMLAVSQLLAKPDGSHRQEWLEQPNCGSCHSGNGAEAVAKKAYDPNDPSATTLMPRSDRFAVRPATVQIRTGTWEDGKMPLKDYVSTAFRHSRDSHANLACAACHGPGHALWPNRDPKANDNVTALQLQGFPGSIMECSVCHTKDAFAKFESLDGGQYTGLPADSGILGGPHGLHPMRDKNWWQSAKGDNLNGGGWHDNVYRRPGLNGEDQCAACHGVNHKGTRLSKTPVDLSFKLANGGVATWKVGEEVGCNKCHTLDKSFRNGPKGF